MSRDAGNETGKDQSSTPNRLSTKRYIAVAAGLLCLIGAGISANILKDDIRAMLRSPTAQEVRIQNALKSSVLPGGSRVDCEPRPGNTDAGSDRGIPGVGYIRVIHLRPDICSQTIAYADSKDKMYPDVKQTEALVAAVHEAKHITETSSDEQLVDCVAFQEVPRFSVALGASSTEAATVKERYVQYYYRYGGKYWSSECSNGGEYDREDTPGIFPNP